MKIVHNSPDKVIVQSGNNEAHIFAKPFKLDLYFKNVLVINTNARGLLKFEHHRQKPLP